MHQVNYEIHFADKAGAVFSARINLTTNSPTLRPLGCTVHAACAGITESGFEVLSAVRMEEMAIEIRLERNG